MRRPVGSRSRPLALATSLLALLVLAAPAWARLVAPKDSAGDPKAGFPRAVYDDLLGRYVDADGRVDYRRLSAEARPQIEALYAAIAARPADPPGALLRPGPARDEALAFYLNAYNVLAWKTVVDRLGEAPYATAGGTLPPPEESARLIEERMLGFYAFTHYVVAGKPMGLEELKGRIWRDFHDPRAYLALSCGAASCPPPPPRAYQGEQLGAQLDAQARRFLGRPENLEYDPAAGRLRLSAIFSWYGSDFGKGPQGLLHFVNRFRDPGQALPMSGAGKAGKKAPVIEFHPFDWRLNQTR